jgi:hypothetical protein
MVSDPTTVIFLPLKEASAFRYGQTNNLFYGKRLLATTNPITTISLLLKEGITVSYGPFHEMFHAQRLFVIPNSTMLPENHHQLQLLKL